MVAKQIVVVRGIIAAADKMCHHMLSHGDIVYVDEDRRPYRIMHVGYGDYDAEVRILQLTEASTWSGGRWVHSSRCFLLEVGDNLEAMEDVVDSSEDQ